MYIERLKKLNHTQCVQFAVFCAEQVLPVFEKQYPDDSRPLGAIDAAKAWLEPPHIANPDSDDAADAADDAADDAYAASRSAAHAASRSAAHAAEAASATAAAHDDLSYAAGHADHAAYRAVHAGADRTAIETYLKELEKCTSID